MSASYFLATGVDAKLKHLDGATLAPMSWRYACVLLSALVSLLIIQVPLAINMASSTSTFGSTFTYFMSMGHGLMRSATIIIDMGHPWGMEYLLAYGHPMLLARLLWTCCNPSWYLLYVSMMAVGMPDT